MSQCQNCGAEITAAFCTNCGAQVDVPRAAGAPRTVAVNSYQPPQPYPAQAFPAQPMPQRQSALQLWLGAGSCVVGLLTLIVSGYLYLKSNSLGTDWQAIDYYDASWAVMLSGGGVAVVAAGVSLFLKGRNRALAIAGLALGAISVTLGFVLAA